MFFLSRVSRSLTSLKFLIPATTAITGDSSSTIVLEDFGFPVHEWQQMNDPVMGGRSTGTFELKGGVGKFSGNVAIVPFLKAPGFIKVETIKGESWPDISSCEGLRFTARASTEYSGYRVSFGNNRPPDSFPYSYGYKADIELDMGVFLNVEVPFDLFTDKWDPGTGDPVVSCKDDIQYCPDEATKKDISTIAVWGEGVEGKVDLEIKMIAAYGCGASPSGAVLPSPPPPKLVSNLVSQPAPLVKSDEISIEDFSKALNTWGTLNDPVMGGKSESSVVIENGVAHFNGRCAIVPFLKAPGFITMVTGGYQTSATFPDVSTCSSLKVVLRTTVQYAGYYLSFGTARTHDGGHAMGYKTPLDIAASSEFTSLVLPFSSFSSKWNEATGKTEIECSEDPQYCPTIEVLEDMKTMSFWGEGVEGDIALEIRSISATGCGNGDFSSIIPLMSTKSSPHLISTSSLGFILGLFTSRMILFCCTLGFMLAYGMVMKRGQGQYDGLSTHEEVKLIVDDDDIA